MDKEKRSPNFTQAEIEILIDLSIKYKHIIENKRTDATTWKEKNDMWQQITDEFNAISGNFPRTVKTVRAKYETVKKDLRKACAKVKEEIKKTGGGLIQCPSLKPYEEKFLSINQISMLGLPAMFDNDVTEPENLPQVDDQLATNVECDVNEIHENTVVNNELPNSSDEEIRIEYIDNDEEMFPQPMPMNNNQKENDMSQKRKRRAVKCNKFIHKNKKREDIPKAATKNDLVDVKKIILDLQKMLLEQEVTQKSIINSLIIDNLKKDLEIKELLLQEQRKKVQSFYN